MNPKLILTADPSFTELAIAELKKAQPEAEILRELADGVFAIGFADDFFVPAELWRKYPPVFIRHICPVLLTITPVELDKVVQETVAELIDWVDPELPFSVQTRIFDDVEFKPFDVNTAVSQALQTATKAELNVRNPAQIVSIVVTEEAAYVGLSLALHNISDWAGGVRRFAREKEQISRAEFKLLEALEWFKIELVPNSIALDLGAAPGGWTRVLRQKEQYVTAVDPANLDFALQEDRNVRHLAITAEDYLEMYPDKFDLIVNDMRMDARDSARLMVAYAPYLYADGLAIMTFKLPNENRESAIDHALNILKRPYDIIGVRQLFHNRSEVTVVLKPKRD